MTFIRSKKTRSAAKARGRTYEEWGKLGFHIRKGSKADGRNKDGKATFSAGLVERNRFGRKASYDPRDGDAEHELEMHDLYNYDGYFDNIGDR